MVTTNKNSFVASRINNLSLLEVHQEHIGIEHRYEKNAVSVDSLIVK